MSRPRNPAPAYKKHPTKDEARCWADGRWVSLGRWDTPASRAAHARLLAELAAGGGRRPAPTVAELLAAFRAHAATHYRRPDGSATSEVKEYAAACRVLRELYGDTAAADFGPVALQAVRAAMVGKGWCRGRINKQVGRLRRVFRWGVAQELVPAAVVTALDCVAGLRAGRSAAREAEPVGPVPDADVARTLPFLTPTVRAMVGLQRAAGLRPGEVRLLQPADLDTTGDPWAYRPEDHKMTHLGRDRAAPLGPAARALLAPLLAGLAPTAYVFAPAASRAEMYARRRAARKTPVPPSQRDRAKPAGDRAREVCPPHFTDHGYANVIRRACVRAGVPHWHPGQLRHTFATDVRDKYGPEAAQALLGHAHIRTTEIYAEKSWALAARVAGEIG
jgi:integrase